MVKQVKQRGEEAKIAIRNHRRDANEMLKDFEKSKDISKDELQIALEKVQQNVDSAIKQIDVVVANKEKDVLEI